MHFDQSPIRLAPLPRVPPQEPILLMGAYELIHLALGIGPIATPTILPRMPHPLRTHRVQLDVAVTREHIVVRLHQKRSAGTSFMSSLTRTLNSTINIVACPPLL